ncbi:MAG: hypothetical protein ACFFEO_15585 [Candidatus Thorarchaeota archaeon]
MNRSKTFLKVLILLIVGIMCFGFISTVQASRVNFRPIEDWLLNNPTGSGGNYLNEDYVINIGNPFLRPILLDEILLVNGETTYDGYIQERILNDGSAQLTVNLWVHNAPLTIYSFPDFLNYILGGPRPNAIIGAYEDGYIDYKYQFTFNLPNPGMEIPNLWDLYFSEADVMSQVIGKGYGTFSESFAPFFTPGAKGMVTLNQICLVKPQLEDLEINKLYGIELWPTELINIQQIE